MHICARDAQQKRVGLTWQENVKYTGRKREEWDVLKGMRKFDECDMEEFGRLESSGKTTPILGGRWWPQAAKQEGDKISKQIHVIYGKKVKSVQMFEVSLLAVGTVLRLQRNA